TRTRGRCARYAPPSYPGWQHRPASQEAEPTYTQKAHGARLVAAAAMVGVRRGVDTTTAPAIGEPTRAFHDAFSRDAAHRSTAGRTAVAASAAMGDIALKVDTRARAVL